MLSHEQLLHLACEPRSAPALGDDEVLRQLAVLPGWRLDAGALRRDFTFADWARTMAFVNALSRVAEALDHHPDLGVHWGRCEVAFSTHSAGGVTLNDFACAARVGALAEARS